MADVENIYRADRSSLFTCICNGEQQRLEFHEPLSDIAVSVRPERPQIIVEAESVHKDSDGQQGALRIEQP